MDISLKGKTALVTGGTSGIGLETARALARLGAQVTIVSRSAERCAQAATRLGSRETGNPVAWIAADLSTLEGVMQAAMTFKQQHTRLHILVNNAGGIFFKRALTRDGFETTFALNHLGYFLLTILLLDTLKSSAPARIVNVASGMHARVKALDFANLQGEQKYSGWDAYARSKLCNLLFAYELARRLEGSGVTANALTPGYVATNIGADNGPLFETFAKLSARLFGRRPEVGARTGVHLAAAPEVEGVTGKYFADCREIPSSPLSHDRAAAEKLWQVSLELAGKAI
ncbi:MAG: putative oxidoreductase [Anaerolineaceae bacterium]|nr:MAG: putative oxidoreductase [Anaerolineaceae bacterium]